MKTYLILALMLGAVGVGFTLDAQEATPSTVVAPNYIIDSCKVKHKPSEVTVYTDRAVVVRSGVASLKKGTNEVRFEGINDNIDLRSIRGIDPKNGEVDIQGISWQRFINKKIDNEKLNLLELQKRNVQIKMNQIQDDNLVIARQNELITTTSALLRKSINESSAIYTSSEQVASWEKSLSELSAKATANATKTIENKNAIQALHEDLSKVEHEIRGLYGDGFQHSQITLVLTVNAKREVTLPLSVSYTTYSASWKPAYDAWINSESGEVDFLYSGTVFQKTGESWQHVALKLSTAQPQVSATPPALQVPRLFGYESTQQPKVVAKQGDVANQAVTATEYLLIADDNYSDESGEAGEAELSQVNTKGAAVTFNIATPQTLQSGDQPTTVMITRQTFKGDISFESAPELRNGAYLKTQFVNQTAYPILSGRINIYRNSGYIGSSECKYVPVNAEFSCFAGTLDEVSSAVIPSEYFNREVGTFSKATESFESRGFEFYNAGEKAVKIRVKTVIAISEIETVKIDIIEKSPIKFVGTTPGYVLNAASGLVYWDVEIQPQQKTTLNLLVRTTQKQ